MKSLIDQAIHISNVNEIIFMFQGGKHTLVGIYFKKIWLLYG